MEIRFPRPPIEFEQVMDPCKVFVECAAAVASHHQACRKMERLAQKLHPIDPNLAISAHVVYPQSAHIRLEKFSTFFQIRTIKKVLTTDKVPIYQTKAHKLLFMQKK